MNSELRGVSEYMVEFGLDVLTHALRLAFYYNMNNPSWGRLSVVQAAHAAEVLIKARIAEEHPLLIFKKLPTSGDAEDGLLNFDDLFQRGHTINFSDLPARLWATTGIKLRNEERFRTFGQLRNSIQHFAPPSENLSELTLHFVFDVLDPFIHDCWGLYAIDYNEEYGEHYEHIFETLEAYDVRPLISPDARQYWQRYGHSPSSGASPAFRQWFDDQMGPLAQDG